MGGRVRASVLGVCAREYVQARARACVGGRGGGRVVVCMFMCLYIGPMYANMYRGASADTAPYSVRENVMYMYMHMHMYMYADPVAYVHMHMYT